mmetsp:Transcript_36335/g.113199  ORF Transcript_36335/g.113199 Transcript_36335/m.113199 type:complete len:150 (+) Transcript_36335:124-573(+)
MPYLLVAALGLLLPFPASGACIEGLTEPAPDSNAEQACDGARMLQRESLPKTLAEVFEDAAGAQTRSSTSESGGCCAFGGKCHRLSPWCDRDKTKCSICHGTWKEAAAKAADPAADTACCAWKGRCTHAVKWCDRSPGTCRWCRGQWKQ